MTILVLENSEPSLRGFCSRFMIELKPGVFVGNLSKTVRDQMWERVVAKNIQGSLMIWSDSSEQGFSWQMFGVLAREPEDFDGVVLLRRNLQDDSAQNICYHFYKAEQR